MQKIIIASGPVIVEDNKVLLNQHGDTEFWKFCGGKVEDYDQNLQEAAAREVKEEMGIEIKITNPRPFITYTTKEMADVKIDVILVHWLAEKIGEIKPGEDIREWQWFDIDDLPDNLALNIIPTLKHFGFIK
ncbi:NUDIX hydrolase [Candidatus Nomurabacteria bacterium]|nr:NUDIX hydrolase [Candidatus Nomurabacteria bacterium]